MASVHRAAVAVLVVTLMTDITAAQSATGVAQTAGSPARDSLWNGMLIGLGAGIGAAATLDAVFCDAEGGRCDFPWAAYLTLGGIGAGAGAGIDFLIGRKSDQGKATVSLSPVISRSRKAILASLVFPAARSLPPLAKAQQNGTLAQHDSVWYGALIGGGIGAGGGYLWGRNMCGTNDSECFAIAGPVGILGGIGIGLAAGAVADALHK